MENNEDDKYYIGEFNYNIPNGKGIKYYKNRKYSI